MKAFEPGGEYRLSQNGVIPMRLMEAVRIPEPTYFTDLEVHSGPYHVLRDEEVKVLLELALMTINSFATPPTQGTLKICGRKNGQGLQRVATANLCLGVSKVDSLLLTSDKAVHQAMEWIVESDPDKQASLLPNHSLDCQYPEDAGCYRITALKPYDLSVFSVTTTYGQFLMSFYTNARPEAYLEEKVMWALAQALCEMRQHDIGLTKSMDKARVELHDNGETEHLVIMSAIKSLFENCITPSFHEWQNTQNITRAVRGSLPLYFE